MIWKAIGLLGVAACVLGDGPHAISEQHVVLNIKPEYIGHHGELAHIGDQSPEHHDQYAWSYPSYEFSYKVEDPHTHDFKGQHEHRDGDKVRGVYWLLQPDGYKRTVKYHADEHSGFHADVHYEKSNHPIHHEAINHHEPPKVIEEEVNQEHKAEPRHANPRPRIIEARPIVVEQRREERREPRRPLPIALQKHEDRWSYWSEDRREEPRQEERRREEPRMEERRREEPRLEERRREEPRMEERREEEPRREEPRREEPIRVELRREEPRREEIRKPHRKVIESYKIDIQHVIPKHHDEHKPLHEERRPHKLVEHWPPHHNEERRGEERREEVREEPREERREEIREERREEPREERREERREGRRVSEQDRRWESERSRAISPRHEKVRREENHHVPSLDSYRPQIREPYYGPQNHRRYHRQTAQTIEKAEESKQ